MVKALMCPKFFVDSRRYNWTRDCLACVLRSRMFWRHNVVLGLLLRNPIKRTAKHAHAHNSHPALSCKAPFFPALVSPSPCFNDLTLRPPKNLHPAGDHARVSYITRVQSRRQFLNSRLAPVASESALQQGPTIFAST